MKNEMHRQIVGPCTESELNEIRAGLVKLGENVEPEKYWNFYEIAFFETYNSEWITSDQPEPTISAADFIKTYLQP